MRKVWKSLSNENVMRSALFRGENENLSSNADVLQKPQNLVMLRYCFADDGNEWTKIKRTRAERAKLLSLATSMQNCDVLVDVTVVVAEAPY